MYWGKPFACVASACACACACQGDSHGHVAHITPPICLPPNSYFLPHKWWTVLQSSSSSSTTTTSMWLWADCWSSLRWARTTDNMIVRTLVSNRLRTLIITTNRNHRQSEIVWCYTYCCCLFVVSLKRKKIMASGGSHGMFCPRSDNVVYHHR